MQSFDLSEHPLAEERRTTDLRNPEVMLHPNTFAAFFSAECKSLSTQNHGNCGFLSQAEGTPSGIIVDYFNMIDRSFEENGHLPCFLPTAVPSGKMMIRGQARAEFGALAELLQDPVAGLAADHPATMIELPRGMLPTSFFATNPPRRDWRWIPLRTQIPLDR